MPAESSLAEGGHVFKLILVPEKPLILCYLIYYINFNLQINFKWVDLKGPKGIFLQNGSKHIELKKNFHCLTYFPRDIHVFVCINMNSAPQCLICMRLHQTVVGSDLNLKIKFYDGSSVGILSNG